MAKIEIDTKKLNEYGIKIRKITNGVNSKLNQLFSRMENVPTNYEWVGASSVKYVGIIKKEKPKYYKFKDDLDLYGKFLCDFSDSTNVCINRIRRMF